MGPIRNMRFVIGTAILAAVAATAFSSYSVDAFTTAAAGITITTAPTLFGRSNTMILARRGRGRREKSSALATEIDRKFVRKEIDRMTADNFESTLNKIEPFLLSD